MIWWVSGFRIPRWWWWYDFYFGAVIFLPLLFSSPHPFVFFPLHFLPSPSQRQMEGENGMQNTSTAFLSFSSFLSEWETGIYLLMLSFTIFHFHSLLMDIYMTLSHINTNRLREYQTDRHSQHKAAWSWISMYMAIIVIFSPSPLLPSFLLPSWRAFSFFNIHGIWSMTHL